MDVTGVRETSFFEVTTQTNKYEVSDVTADFLPYLNVMMGDVNGDGQLTISDVTMLISYVLGTEQPTFILAAADVTGDGNINIADVTRLISMVLSNS